MLAMRLSAACCSFWMRSLTFGSFLASGSRNGTVALARDGTDGLASGRRRDAEGRVARMCMKAVVAMVVG